MHNQRRHKNGSVDVLEQKIKVDGIFTQQNIAAIGPGIRRAALEIVMIAGVHQLARFGSHPIIHVEGHEIGNGPDQSRINFAEVRERPGRRFGSSESCSRKFSVAGDSSTG